VGFNSLIFAIDEFIPAIDLQQKNNWRVALDGASDCTSPVWLQGFLFLYKIIGWAFTFFTAAALAFLVTQRVVRNEPTEP
jgi:hypothetical protein